MGKRKVEVNVTAKTRKRYVGEELVTHVLYDGQRVLLSCCFLDWKIR